MYGGAGGYGGMGSTYGGYGGLGSSSGIGSYGGNYGAGYDPYNKRPLNEGEQKEGQQQNKGKMVFEQWSKMIGGLRSIIELGMAGIAIANFYNYASDIVKKMIDFIKSAGAKILKFLHRKFAAKMLNNLAQPDRRMKTIKALIFNFVRVVALLMLGLSAKLKMDIKKDNSQRLQKLQREYQKCKNGEMQLTKVQEGEGFLEAVEPELMMTAANL